MADNCQSPRHGRRVRRCCVETGYYDGRIHTQAQHIVKIHSRLEPAVDHATPTVIPVERPIRVEDVVYQFEQAFRAGAAPRIDDFLLGDGPDRWHLLVELIHSELELRTRAGQPAELANYLALYPTLVHLPNELGAVLETELRLRARAGATPDLAEYEAKYAALGKRVREAFRRVGSAPPDVPGCALRAFVRLEYHRFTTGVSWFEAKAHRPRRRADVSVKPGLYTAVTGYCVRRKLVYFVHFANIPGIIDSLEIDLQLYVVGPRRLCRWFVRQIVGHWPFLTSVVMTP